MAERWPEEQRLCRETIGASTVMCSSWCQVLALSLGTIRGLNFGHKTAHRGSTKRVSDNLLQNTKGCTMTGLHTLLSCRFLEYSRRHAIVRSSDCNGDKSSDVGRCWLWLWLWLWFWMNGSGSGSGPDSVSVCASQYVSVLVLVLLKLLLQSAFVVGVVIN